MEYDKILKEVLGRDEYLVVGKTVTRTDALDKVLGKSRYTGDYIPHGTNVLKVFRSAVPHARIHQRH